MARLAAFTATTWNRVVSFLFRQESKHREDYQKVTPEDIKPVVREVLAEHKLLTLTDIDHVALKTIATVLSLFGIDAEYRTELKADFNHLRRWRECVEQAQSYALKAVMAITMTGFMAAAWLGVKVMLGK